MSYSLIMSHPAFYELYKCSADWFSAQYSINLYVFYLAACLRSSGLYFKTSSKTDTSLEFANIEGGSLVFFFLRQDINQCILETPDFLEKTDIAICLGFVLCYDLRFIRWRALYFYFRLMFKTSN
jgi:hypothetical protein